MIRRQRQISRRLERAPDRGSADQLQFSQAGDVYHFTMGSAGTFYNSAWTKTGDYQFSARLTQNASHPIYYGAGAGRQRDLHG
jgi:hypothetical protein